MLRRGFSLIELLVALSILAAVAGIIIPKFLNIRSQGYAVAAQQIVRQLNSTWTQWQDLGGKMTVTPTFWSSTELGTGTSNVGVHYILNSSPGVNTDSGDGSSFTYTSGPKAGQTRVTPASLSDNGNSNQARLAFPADLSPYPTLVTNPPLPSGDSNTAYCADGNVMIYFDGSKFTSQVIDTSSPQASAYTLANATNGTLQPFSGASGPATPSWWTFTPIGGAQPQFLVANLWNSGQQVSLGYGMTATFIPSGSYGSTINCGAPQSVYGYYQGEKYMAVYECSPNGVEWNIYKLPSPTVYQ